MTARNECVAELTRALEQVAAGDYSVRLDTHGEEQFEILAAAFNAMQARLRDTVSSLELAIRNLHEKQGQLLEAEKLALLGRVTAGVAHEINNPLAVMNEKAGLLQDLLGLAGEFAAKEEYVKLVEGILAQVRRCRVITHTLLGYVRRVDLTIEPLGLNQLVLEVRENLAQLGREKDIVVRLDLSADLPVIPTDKVQLEQVIVNLVRNAIEAAPPSGEVAVKTALADQRTAVIIVSDNGPGISREFRTHLFEPFFTTKEKGEGTGLGLYISLGIMKRLGGALLVESEPGQGTRFTIEVPLHFRIFKESADE